MYRTTLTIVAILMLLANIAAADLLVLGNGDTLSGAALRVREGALVFRTSLAGQMMAPMDTISALTTDENFAFGFADGTTRYGHLEQTDNGAVLVPLDGGDAAPVTLADITSGEIIPNTARPPKSGDERIQVGLESGVRVRQGMTDTVEPYARLELSGTKPSREFDASVMVERADPDDFPANAEAEMEWRMRKDDSRQPFLAASAERDTGNALDLRTDFTLGLGRVLMAHNRGTLYGTAGLNAAYESWDRSEVMAGGNAEHDRSELNLRLGLRYARTLLNSGNFSNELILYPALSDPGDFRATNTTALGLPLTNCLQLRLDLELGYDNSPGFQELDEWRGAFGAGISVEF